MEVARGPPETPFQKWSYQRREKVLAHLTHLPSTTTERTGRKQCGEIVEAAVPIGPAGNPSSRNELKRGGITIYHQRDYGKRLRKAVEAQVGRRAVVGDLTGATRSGSAGDSPRGQRKNQAEAFQPERRRARAR